MRRMFLNGTAMSGQPDHHAMAGSTFLGSCRTAARYRFVAVRDAFPGLLPMSVGGSSIAGELYEISEDQLFGSLMPHEPAELELGTIELEHGGHRQRHASAARPHRGGRLGGGHHGIRRMARITNNTWLRGQNWASSIGPCPA